MFTRSRLQKYDWIRVPPLTRKGLLGERTLDRATDNLLNLSDVDDLHGVAPSRLSFADALATIGVPSLDEPPEKELVDLLVEAAHIEHGLILQYLYAAYSLKELVIQGTLRTIAIEEMGHFITVQNLLIACGSKPYLGNHDWNVPNLFHPFPFKLEPASVGSIAKYTIAEMPDRNSVPADVQPDLNNIIGDANSSAGVPVEPHRVGLLYTKIYWLLRRDDHPLADPSQEPWPGFPVAEMAAEPKLARRHVGDGFVRDALAVNAQPAEWKGNYSSVIVAPISNRDVALSAIASVTAQGEGFVDSKQSHFHRFVEMWRIAKRTTDLAAPAPVDPWYANGGTPSVAGDEVRSDLGRKFAKMGDYLYELVILCSAANLVLPAGTAPTVRKSAAQAAIFAMRDCLGQVANALSTIPLTDDALERKVCGIPFAVAPLDIEAQLKAVIDRAVTVMAVVKEIAAEVSQSGASATLKTVADGVASSIDDDIKPRLSSLPV